MVGTKRAVAGENIAADAATNKRSDDALVATMIKSNILMLAFLAAMLTVYFLRDLLITAADRHHDDVLCFATFIP